MSQSTGSTRRKGAQTGGAEGARDCERFWASCEQRGGEITGQRTAEESTFEKSGVVTTCQTRIRRQEVERSSVQIIDSADSFSIQNYSILYGNVQSILNKMLVVEKEE